MDYDWYVASIDAIAQAADELRAALDSTLATLAPAREERLAGVGLVDIVSGLVARGGRTTRLAPTVAFREFELAVTAYRARAIQALVDDEHLTFTEVAKLTGVSRQMIARLYSSSVESNA
ncbi:MAG: hypothetical protein QOG53_2653 [Frankiales bacterium]|jgi:hypothetical protein|nr:hypothetical protein [Frankiales bacterium]